MHSVENLCVDREHTVSQVEAHKQGDQQAGSADRFQLDSQVENIGIQYESERRSDQSHTAFQGL